MHHQVLQGGIVRHLRMLRSLGTKVVIANHEIPESALWLIAGPSAKIVRVQTRAINEYASAASCGPSPEASCEESTSLSRLARSLLRRAACQTLVFLLEQGGSAGTHCFLEATVRLQCHGHEEPGSEWDGELESMQERVYGRDEGDWRHGGGAEGGTKGEGDQGNGAEEGKGQEPVVMLCVGVPWDMLLQAMLHSAVAL